MDYSILIGISAVVLAIIAVINANKTNREIEDVRKWIRQKNYLQSEDFDDKILSICQKSDICGENKIGNLEEKFAEKFDVLENCFKKQEKELKTQKLTLNDFLEEQRKLAIEGIYEMPENTMKSKPKRVYKSNSKKENK